MRQQEEEFVLRKQRGDRVTLRAAGPLRSRRGGPSRPAQTGGVP